MSIEIRNLSKNFKSIKALDDVSISFEKNKINALIGFNGSGKTTLFNILSGFIKEDSGEILINGLKPSFAYYKSISFISGASDEKNMEQVKNYLNYIGEVYQMNKIDIKNHINYFAELLDFKDKLNKPLLKLSKGNRQKIKITACLMNKTANYIFLDEPFDGLDPLMVEKIKLEIIKYKVNATIVITSHRMNIVDEMSDRFLILKNGKIIKVSDKKDLSKIKIIINGSVDIQMLEKTTLKNIKKENGEWTATISKISDFKKINKLLLNSKNFKWISFKRETINDEFLKGGE